jgi:hypothetical protein
LPPNPPKGGLVLRHEFNFIKNRDRTPL